MSSSGGEFDYINWIRAQTRGRANVPIGIGDDAAAVQLTDSENCLVAVDMLMEGTHFTIPAATPELIGRKALAVNLSDIAAMAGSPRFALVSVALSRHLGDEFGKRLFQGMRVLAEEFDVTVVGGDTNIWDGPVVVSVTLMGEATGKGPVTRSGARVGDWIFATGAFGGSLADKQFTFQPRVREAAALHEAVSLHAMIDVSDGLAADLLHVLDESGVGAELNADEIPISDAVRASDDGRSSLAHALADGEDFELVFTVDPLDGRRLMQGIAGIGADSAERSPPTESRETGVLPVDSLETPVGRFQPSFVQLTKIGEIVEWETRTIIDADGNRTSLKRAGWEHSF